MVTASADMTEQQIEPVMRRALAGDSQAYNQVLQHCSRHLRPYLIKRLAVKADIDDVLQEILLSIHKARNTYDGLRPFNPWMFAIAHYRLQDYLRKYYNDPLRASSELHENNNVSEGFDSDASLATHAAFQEIDKLPGKQPKILNMMHREGYTAKEVAEKLGMQESAIKVAAFRAYKILRKKLG